MQAIPHSTRTCFVARPPEDVAAAMPFLVSEGAGWLSGVPLEVAGGAAYG
jgi:hypothetical protein